MSKTAYNITLKGYAGGADFDRAKVDCTLADNDGKSVNVLIDSLGGSLATGLPISAAFRNHSNVNVNFVGLNASATPSQRILIRKQCRCSSSTTATPSTWEYPTGFKPTPTDRKLSWWRCLTKYLM